MKTTCKVEEPECFSTDPDELAAALTFALYGCTQPCREEQTKEADNRKLIALLIWQRRRTF